MLGNMIAIEPQLIEFNDEPETAVIELGNILIGTTDMIENAELHDSHFGCELRSTHRSQQAVRFNRKQCSPTGACSQMSIRLR